jgi:hypothetical protein
VTIKRFQVALSFPGEKRDYVLQVAELFLLYAITTIELLVLANTHSLVLFKLS